MLEWNVIVEWNGEVEFHNVFAHWRLWEDLCKLRKKFGKRNATEEDRAEFEKQTRHFLMYYYWSKCEWEIVATGFPCFIIDGQLRFGRKLDVWEQVEANWARFFDYLWSNRMLLKGNGGRG